MSVDHVLAVIPVADFEAAHAWYERLFGGPADNLPMEGRLIEWRVTQGVSAATCSANATAATPQPMLHHLEVQEIDRAAQRMTHVDIGSGDRPSVL